MIGRGVQGAVFHGTSRQGTNDGMAVAVKKIREDGDVEVYTNVYLEEHENVLVALDILRDDNFTYIVMPYLEEAEKSLSLILDLQYSFPLFRNAISEDAVMCLLA